MAEKKSRRGLAGMTSAKRRAIGSLGGKAVHAAGAAHRFTHEQAVAAGRKGGKACHAKDVAHEFTSEEARAAGRGPGGGKSE